jgi:hypothetical protein
MRELDFKLNVRGSYLSPRGYVAVHVVRSFDKVSRGDAWLWPHKFTDQVNSVVVEAGALDGQQTFRGALLQADCVRGSKHGSI